MKKALIVLFFVIVLLLVSCKDYISPGFPICVIVENYTLHEAVWKIKKESDLEFSPLIEMHSPGGYLLELDRDCDYILDFYAVDYDSSGSQYDVISSIRMKFSTDCIVNEYHFFLSDGELVYKHERT